MPRILLVLPTSWDRKQLPTVAASHPGRFEVLFTEPTDEDCVSRFDPLEYMDTMVRTHGHHLDGVFSSSDYPGATLAAAIATRLGLPGSAPTAIMKASHKFYSRMAQQEVVPEAVPAFWLVDPTALPPAGNGPRFPCFVKPVKGAFSIMSGKVKTRNEFEAFFSRGAVDDFLCDYILIFNRLVAALTDFEFDGRYFLAEELLHGRQVTVEGYEVEGEVVIVGIVDSILHPRTKSFARFDYPSALRLEIQARMAKIAAEVVRHLGLVRTFFNIEMIYEPSGDRISIIEVNPRLCGQFADLYEKVDGINTYETALDLATGSIPMRARRQGSCGAASSFPLRVFEPVVVEHAPGSETVLEAEALFPGTRVWSECESGQLLDDFERVEDGKSARYAVLNIGARNRKQLMEQKLAVERHLEYRFRPLGMEPSSSPPCG